jgi:AcrR family transcriptional regulator
MRRIGQELDVWPMSLYRYYHDKDALLDALAEAAASDIKLPPARDTWQHQLRALLQQVANLFATHPGGRCLRLTGPDLPPAAASVAEHAREILAHAGLDPTEARRCWQALVSYAQGAATHNPHNEFHYGLQLILDGIQMNIASAAARQQARVA